MKRWTWVLGMMAAAGVATAIAQPPSGGEPGGGGPGGGRPPSPVIEALDADHDGVISADEIKSAAAALAKLDKNKDGRLTEEEFRPQGGRPGQGGPGGEGQGGGPPGGGRGQGGAGGAGGRGPGGGGQAGGQGGPGRGQSGGQGGPGGGQRGPGGEGGPGGPPPIDPGRMLNHAFEFDADKDGKLSKDELRKFIDDFISQHPGPGGGPGGGGPRGGAGGPPNGPGGGGRPSEGGERSERPRRPE